MRLYHFVNATHAINNLSLRRLKVSRFGQLNDPFELLAADLLDPKHRQAFSKFKEQLDKTNGLICFSGSWSNPLLWGHYADKHFGIALGFDVPEDQAAKVSYTSNRATVKFDKAAGKVVDGPNVIDKLIRTKFTDWKYEDEYRIFVSLDPANKEGENYFADFSPDLALQEVILGMRCEIPIERVRQLLGAESDSVKIIRAGMALRSFKLIEDRRFRRTQSSS